MNEYPVWSISKWRDFDQCPMMYYSKSITKRWKETPNEAMVRGQRVHKNLEEAIKYDIELPDDLKHMTPLVEAFIGMRAQGAAVFPEMKFGVSIAYGRVEFFDGKDLRVRVVIDLYVNQDGHLLITDWKTGKYKPEHREDAQFYGSLAHICFGPKKTSVQYFYVDNPECSFIEEINDATATTASWWKKFEYADKLIATGNPPATPCNACAWCGAWECPNNRNQKIKGA